jgi:hypothetical protein
MINLQAGMLNTPFVLCLCLLQYDLKHAKCLPAWAPQTASYSYETSLSITMDLKDLRMVLDCQYWVRRWLVPSKHPRCPKYGPGVDYP